MIPDQLKALFDIYAIPLMFLWGLLCKYMPALAKIPNATIPWVNALAYIIIRFATPTAAHADAAGAVAAIPSALGIIVGGFTSSIWARQLYEGFGRGLLEGLLKRKKAVR